MAFTDIDRTLVRDPERQVLCINGVSQAYKAFLALFVLVETILHCYCDITLFTINNIRC